MIRTSRTATLILAAVCLLALPALAGAQTRAVLADDTIALGDQTTLTMGGSGQLPSAEQLSQDGVLALSQSFDTATGEMLTLITSFEPGEHWLRLPDGDSLPLVVTDVEVDTTSTEIRDIAPLRRVPYTFWEIFRWVLLALLVAAVAFGIWWYATHRQHVQQALGLAEKPDTRTPFERASDSMARLRDTKLWQAGHVKEYYTELTDIVRRFIEESTDVHATDMTSDETLAAVASLADTAPLRELFVLADLVKFAKREPLPHEHEGAMDKAALYVRNLWEQVKPASHDTGKEADGNE
ncbi:MAG: hypothetical protein IJ760_05605 [Bacteroidales bacterium]|nr:hypothetical protein [Bacteroidales bacterium]